MIYKWAAPGPIRQFKRLPMRKQRKISIVLIIAIVSAAIGYCYGQTVEEIGTYPVTQTNAVTLKPSATFPVINEVDPISQRLTITYPPATKQKTTRFKAFALKLRRIFRPNTKT